MKGILKTRKFWKNTEFCNVEFENGRGFPKIHVFDKRTGVFENGQSVLISKLSEKWYHRVNSLYLLDSLPVEVESH